MNVRESGARRVPGPGQTGGGAGGRGWGSARNRLTGVAVQGYYPLRLCPDTPGTTQSERAWRRQRRLPGFFFAFVCRRLQERVEADWRHG
jgi:hypothetical protein